jgi:predicted enzyme related to lactoylglutathione lyase
MKRFHVHMNVVDLDGSIRFYSQLFGVDPAVRRGVLRSERAARRRRGRLLPALIASPR